MSNTFSLAPGFSPVKADAKLGNRFNGFSPAGKLLKQLVGIRHPDTRLKPGANEMD